MAWIRKELNSSHVLDAVEKVCHRIIVIDHGSLIADVALEELKSRTNERSLEDISRKLTHAEDGTEPVVQGDRIDFGVIKHLTVDLRGFSRLESSKTRG
jgi:ABC-type multidrug transport system ATPase subunit